MYVVSATLRGLVLSRLRGALRWMLRGSALTLVCLSAELAGATPRRCCAVQRSVLQLISQGTCAHGRLALDCHDAQPATAEQFCANTL